MSGLAGPMPKTIRPAAADGPADSCRARPGDDRPRLLHHREERHGRSHAARGMMPVQQRLVAIHLAAQTFVRRMMIKLDSASAFARRRYLRPGLEMRAHEGGDEEERAPLTLLGTPNRRARRIQGPLPTVGKTHILARDRNGRGRLRITLAPPLSRPFAGPTSCAGPRLERLASAARRWLACPADAELEVDARADRRQGRLCHLDVLGTLA
ncbi:hypothetical protein SAMN07250955_110113 [Arboricoccus pini]|uniref:Uncharacterized protein n=1 Tax=Arboricoccus pini TaxID=1963835 RepID=A0A212RLH8_9PROT|nr:hypothetical protein SAMN07250955_110113 [Arboricoccus pini]